MENKDAFIFDNMEILSTDWNRSVFEFYNPIVYNQLPFLHEEMKVGEFLIERKYLGEHYDEFLKGEYTPLWKQPEQTAEKIRQGIMERYVKFFVK